MFTDDKQRQGRFVYGIVCGRWISLRYTQEEDKAELLSL